MESFIDFTYIRWHKLWSDLYLSWQSFRIIMCFTHDLILTLLPQYILWLSPTWLLANTKLYLVNCVIKVHYVLAIAVHIFNTKCVIYNSVNFYLYSGSFAALPKIFVVKFSSVEPYYNITSAVLTSNLCCFPGLNMVWFFAFRQITIISW